MMPRLIGKAGAAFSSLSHSMETQRKEIVIDGAEVPSRIGPSSSINKVRYAIKGADVEAAYASCHFKTTMRFKCFETKHKIASKILDKIREISNIAHRFQLLQNFGDKVLFPLYQDNNIPSSCEKLSHVAFEKIFEDYFEYASFYYGVDKAKKAQQIEKARCVINDYFPVNAAQGIAWVEQAEIAKSVLAELEKLPEEGRWIALQGFEDSVLKPLSMDDLRIQERKHKSAKFNVAWIHKKIDYYLEAARNWREKT